MQKGHRYWFIGYLKDPEPCNALDGILTLNTGILVDSDNLHAVFKTDRDELFMAILENVYFDEASAWAAILSSNETKLLN